MNLHFKEYAKERSGLSTLERSYGFATYKFRGTDCYIEDIYVVPELRKEGKAAEMADAIADIARSKGYHVLTGSVDARANGAQDSIKVLLAYGMRPYCTEGHVTYFKKEI